MRHLTAQQAMHVGHVAGVVVRMARELPQDETAVFALLGEIDRINLCAELLGYGKADDLGNMPLHLWIDEVCSMAGRFTSDYADYLASEINPALARHKDKLVELIGGASDANTGSNK